MATVVPKQFLFTADPGSSLILGFEINRDGGLSPVPGSPFVSPDSPALVAAIGKNLIVAGKTTLAAFMVEKQTGAIRKIDTVTLGSMSSLVSEPSSGTVVAGTPSGPIAIQIDNNKLQATPASLSVPSGAEAERIFGTTLKDTTGKFVFVLNRSTGMINRFSAQDGRALPGSIPAGHGALSISLVVP